MPETMFETYRGAVAASECDAFGHLNIAFYPERFEAAAGDLLERLDVRGGWRTRALDVRYRRELRAGDGLVIASAIIAAEPGLVRVGHHGTLPSGETATLAEHSVVLAEPAAITVAPVRWEDFDAPDAIGGEGSIASGRDRVRRDEVGAAGLTLGGFVRRFSDACLFAVDAIGLTESYRRSNNRGFATFETRLSLEHPPPGAGEGTVVTSGIVAIGTSSLRLAHVMRAARDGRRLARFLQAGVHFDLAARRGTPWPAEVRERAESFRIPGS